MTFLGFLIVMFLTCNPSIVDCQVVQQFILSCGLQKGLFLPDTFFWDLQVDFIYSPYERSTFEKFTLATQATVRCIFFAWIVVDATDLYPTVALGFIKTKLFSVC